MDVRQAEFDQLHADADVAGCVGIIESASPLPALSARSTSTKTKRRGLLATFLSAVLVMP